MLTQESCQRNVVKSRSGDELTTDVLLTLARDSLIADVHIYKEDKHSGIVKARIKFQHVTKRHIRIAG